MNHLTSTAWPVVLSVAGFDPSAGAGIVADLKTFAAHNCYGVAAITALTVQNSQGVASVHPVEPLQLKNTILSLLADGRVKAIKIGMLCNQPTAEVVCEILEANPQLPSVLDPVVRSSNEFELLNAGGVDYVRRELLSRVTVVTPNLAEAGALAGMPVDNLDSMKAAARRLVEMGAHAVVVTGGHLEKAIDVFLSGTTMESFVGDQCEARQHPRHGLHVFLSRGRQPCLGSSLARCRGFGQGVRGGSHSPGVPHRTGPHSLAPPLPHGAAYPPSRPLT